MKIKVTILVVLLLNLVLFGIWFIFIKPYTFTINTGISWCEKEKSKEEEFLHDFINNKLRKNDYGIYTTYLEKPNEQETTKGHTVLSESHGLWMLYAVGANDKEAFDESYGIIKDRLLTSKGLVAWRYDDNEISKGSSTIDDLRIIKALIYGYDRWKENKYKHLAASISQHLLKNVEDNGYIFDFNDGSLIGQDVTICYLDLTTMNYLKESNKKWNKIYANSLDIIKNAQITKGLPLFKKSYRPNLGEYSNETETELVYSLIALKYLQSANVDITPELDWLWNEFNKDKKVYIKYSSKGEKLSDIESTSIYSFIGELFENDGRFNEAENIKKRMKEFQIKKSTSPVYGAFGEEKTMDIYSYDNLNALIFLSSNGLDD